MTVNISGSSPYNTFLKQAGVSTNSSGISAPNPETNIPSVTVGEVQNKEKQGRKKLFGIIGISAGSVLLLGIIAIFTLPKGFTGSFANSLKKLAASARKNINDLTKQTKQLTSKQKLQLKWNRFIENASETVQAGSNVTAIKDSFFFHWLKKLKMDNFINKVNSVFKRIILKTKNNSYHKSEQSIANFCTLINKIAEQNPSSESAKTLQKLVNKLQKQYMSEFSTLKHTTRSQKAWDSMNTLHSRVYNTIFKPEKGFLKGLKTNRKNFKTYITTTLVAKDKELMFAKLAKTQKTIEKTLENILLAVEKDSPEYKLIQQKAEKITKNIQKAIAHESAAYDKLAELQVGSAHTDIIGILAPTALATFFVVNSKDKDELIKNTLTRGIPIIGGVATGYYGNARGFTGVKNLALGLSTGYLLNIIGTETNKLVKQYRVEQAKLKKAFEAFTKMQLSQLTMHKGE